MRMGKRGTLVIPKAIREECKLVEGTQMEVSLEDRAIVLLPSVSTRTRMDDNFDEARAILSAGGVTLEMALAKLTEIKARTEQSQEMEADERPIAAYVVPGCRPPGGGAFLREPGRLAGVWPFEAG